MNENRIENYTKLDYLLREAPRLIWNINQIIPHIDTCVVTIDALKPCLENAPDGSDLEPKVRQQIEELQELQSEDRINKG